MALSLPSFLLVVVRGAVLAVPAVALLVAGDRGMGPELLFPFVTLKHLAPFSALRVRVTVLGTRPEGGTA